MKFNIKQKPLVEKEIATHSIVLGWRIPGMTEPGGLPSTGSHRVGHDLSDFAAETFGRDIQNAHCIFSISLV